MQKYFFIRVINVPLNRTKKTKQMLIFVDFSCPFSVAKNTHMQTKVHNKIPFNLLLILLIVASFISDSIAELVQVQYMSRHCDRTPWKVDNIIPKDPIDWRQATGYGWGELTGIFFFLCENVLLHKKIRFGYGSMLSIGSNHSQSLLELHCQPSNFHFGNFTRVPQ